MGQRARVIRREQLKGFLWAVPAWVVAYLLIDFIDSFSDQPWLVVGVLSPLLGALWFLGRPLVRDRRMLLGGGFLAFFVAFCLFFALAAGTELLDGKRTPLAGFEDAVPPNFLGLNRLGDWHYAVTPEAPPMRDVVVVTLPSFGGQDPMVPRLVQRRLIELAVEREAKAVVFDYFLDGMSRVDEDLCVTIRRAEDAGVPVFYGYVLDSLLNPRPWPETLDACVAGQRRGSLSGYLEADGRIRMVPLYRPGPSDDPSLSYRLARLQAGPDAVFPDVRLLPFTKPADGPKHIDLPLRFDPTDLTASIVAVYASLDSLLTARRADVETFRDNVVLVGSSRAGDVHATPFGSLPGVMIHAYTAHSLHTGHFIRRLGRFWSFPLIFVLCYLLVALQARGGGRKALLLGAAVLSIAVVATAALAMWLALVWVDVSYPLAAVWVLTGVLAGGAAVQAARTRAATAPPAAAEQAGEAVECTHFDVFLSYNRQDQEGVLQLGEALKARRLCVWLDVWEIRPGADWQQALEEVIETVGCAAILIGPDGLGPWEVPEMRACLDECVARDLPVIPVLLPGVEATPALPLFLRRFSWLDLREGLTPDGLARLEWGITGIKP